MHNVVVKRWKHFSGFKDVAMHWYTLIARCQLLSFKNNFTESVYMPDSAFRNDISGVSDREKSVFCHMTHRLCSCQ